MPFTHSASIRSSIGPPSPSHDRLSQRRPSLNRPRTIHAGYSAAVIRNAAPQSRSASANSIASRMFDCSTSTAAAHWTCRGPNPVVLGAQDETLEPVEVPTAHDVRPAETPPASPARTRGSSRASGTGREPPSSPPRLAHEYRLVHERGHDVEHVHRPGFVVQHALGRIEIEATREHRQAGPQPPFRVGAQVVAPVDAHPQRLLSAGLVRPPSVSNRKRSLSRSRICSTDSARSLAARPTRSAVAGPSRAQISSTTARCRPVTRNRALLHAPVPRTAGPRRTSARPGPVPAATVSGGTRTTASPPIPSGSRLVASIDRPGTRGAGCRRSSPRRRPRCSQLSRISSARRPPGARRARPPAGGPTSPADRGRPSPSATAGRDRAGPPTPTNHVSTGENLAGLAGDAERERVLPTPPGPVSVTQARLDSSRGPRPPRSAVPRSCPAPREDSPCRSPRRSAPHRARFQDTSARRATESHPTSRRA